MAETNEKKTEKEKCFVIMPISDQGDYPAGHFTKVYEQIIKPSVEEAGYEAYRVDENNICDTIINKIFKAIQECPMAVCDLSNRNPNVLYELGLRQAYDKPIVLIQDDKTEKIFDVSGISTVFYKSSRLFEEVMEARDNIKKAILSTKEGKLNSLAKIIKVNTADFSQIEVSQDDKTNVMLEGIFNEIKTLKSQMQENDNNSITTRSRSSFGLSESENNVQIMMGCKCNDPEKIREFRNKLSKNLTGLMDMIYERIRDDIWKFTFEFRDSASLSKGYAKIIQLANNLNIETF